MTSVLLVTIFLVIAILSFSIGYSIGYKKGGISKKQENEMLVILKENTILFKNTKDFVEEACKALSTFLH